MSYSSNRLGQVLQRSPYEIWDCWRRIFTGRCPFWGSTNSINSIKTL